jgi:cyclohexyl-isocyanide hydratase
MPFLTQTKHASMAAVNSTASRRMCRDDGPSRDMLLLGIGQALSGTVVSLRRLCRACFPKKEDVVMTDHREDLNLSRRSVVQLAAAGLTAGLSAATGSKAAAGTAAETIPEPFALLHDKPLNIGVLIFPDMDQTDVTGPLAVLARLPNAKVHVIGTQKSPFRDKRGLILTPEMTLDEAPYLDLLEVPGGPGQQALMNNEPVLAFIRGHVASGKPLFSVCTGALICGAAGILKGRRVTTHWASFDLLSHFGATPVQERVVVDGNLVSAAGITAGIDGALTVAALLRGDAAAQRIQLDIQYAPEPPFHAGIPETAPPEVLAAAKAAYQPITDARLKTAREISVRLGVASRS